MKQLLDTPIFRNVLAQSATDTEMTPEDVRRDAEGYLGELVTRHDANAAAIGGRIVRRLLERSFDLPVQVDSEDLTRVAKLMRKGSVVFVLTPKSYLDIAILSTTLVRHGLPNPYVFTNRDNGFAALERLGRRLGSIYLRSDSSDPTYRATLRAYVTTLVSQHGHFIWGLDGTRSRTGKVLWPKLGLLSYLTQGARRVRRPLTFIPVSVTYDLVPGSRHVAETGELPPLSGSSSTQHGSISVQIGQAIAAPPGEDELSKFALDLAFRSDEAARVSTTSLVASALLANVALSRPSLEGEVAALMDIVEFQRTDGLMARGVAIGDAVSKALSLLTGAGIVEQRGYGLDAVYAIADEEVPHAVFYANLATHHLVSRSIVELARVERHTSEMKLWESIFELRDLLKFEFFFPSRLEFADDIERHLGEVLPTFASDVEATSAAPSVLRSVLESYLACAEARVTWVGSIDDDGFLDHAVETATAMNLTRRESSLRPLLLNATRFLGHRNPTVSETKALARQLRKALSLLQLIQDSVVETPAPQQSRQMVPGRQLPNITQEILDGERGPHIGAFFDLDRTLIDGYSAKQFARARILSGDMSQRELLGQFSGLLVYTVGNQNFAALAALSARGVAGVPETAFVQLGEDIFVEHLADSIYPEARALVAAHQAMGHTVAIVSAATPYQVTPIARELTIDLIKATEMEVAEGLFTGNVLRACWGEGKAEAVRALATEHNVKTDASYFYTDSIDDLAALDAVGKPRPLNPDTKLAALAFERDWPVARFGGDERPGAMSLIRTGLAISSMGPSVLAGVGTGLATLSWEKGVNTMIATLGDLGTSLAGIELVVKGAEHLDTRPAVFLFNHQSGADAFLGAKLLRGEAKAIAKKQLKYSIFGPIMMAAGVIFIDRSDRKKAIEAMGPAVDALRSGTSIAIAPEGTRSVDKTLGEFKKGAFHLAMQAQVPIVPMVFRNAHDAMPKGSAVLRSVAVEAVILPPVSTDGWTVDTLDEHVAAIRTMYLEVLGQH